MTIIWEGFKKQNAEGITYREAQILYFMGEGKSNKEIAACLHISVQTVYQHAKNIYRKLNVRNKIEALNKTKSLTSSFGASTTNC